MTDDTLQQIWSQVSEAPSKNLKVAVQESLADRSISVLNQYTYHQAEIIIVRGMGKAKQVTRDSVELVRTSSFFKEPPQPPSEPSPGMSPRASDLVAT